MTGESIGTARIDVTVNADTMEAGIAKAKRAVSGMGTEAEQQYNKAAASSKRYADSLIRQADLLGKTRAEQIAYNAQTRIGGELGDKIAAKALAQQAELAKGMGVTGKSVKELQFAMRGLPAQLTDITVSLAAGQRPLTVLLQQGGQLKDMFGGIGPAAKALGSSLLALINPYTVTAAAVGALALAWSQAEGDASAFNKALITTGNYAGKTAMQLEAMVGSIATTADVTQGSAREALQKVAETGRFTGEQFDLVALAAARMQDATGQSIDDTIKKFEDLGKSPVDALLKLNETEHFLTQSQLDRVRALVAEGNEQEAAAEAARIYAGRLDEVATAAEAARPHLSRMWQEAKEGASGAWEETKKFTEFLAAAADKYKDMPWYKRSNIFGVVSALNGAEPTAPASVSSVPGVVDSAAAKAGIKLEEDAAKFKDRYLTREQEKKRELAELDKLRSEYTAKEYQSLKDQINAKYADKGAVKSGNFYANNDPADMVSIRDQITKAINKQYSADVKLMSQEARGVLQSKEYADVLNKKLDTYRQEAQLQAESIGMGQHEIDMRRQIIDVQKEADNELAKLNRQKNTTPGYTQEQYDRDLAALKSYEEGRIAEVYSADAKIQEARASFANGATAALKDFEYSAGDAAGQTYDIVNGTLNGLADGVASAMTRGKFSVKDFVKSALADLAKMEIRIAASRILMSFFGNSSYGSGAGDSLNGGSNYTGSGSLSTSWGSSGTYNANGGVYTSPSLSAYSGQIVSSPTMFAFAKGAGIMGEAGPEAIMPLTRGHNGKLGVQATGGGGGVVVNQVINVDNNGNASEKTTGADGDAMRQFTSRMKSVAQQTIADEQRPGGSLWRMAHA